MKTLAAIAVILLVAGLASSCDRRDMPENRPTPQPSETTDADSASAAAPSGEAIEPGEAGDADEAPAPVPAD